MCGIAGILTLQQNAGLHQQIKEMTKAIAHRGPDGEAHWVNSNSNLALGHRRLAIIDLSDNAIQPMHYENRYTITYNGELYNYIELKKLLQKKGYIFNTQSDIEVVIAAFDCWKEQCLTHFDGMFAFALWDKKVERLFIARDRFGEKPLYYFHNSDRFVFASEMKALWSIGISRKIDDRMMLNYLSLGYTNDHSDKEVTFYQDIYSIPPAHYFFISTNEFQSIPIKYWSIDRKSKININTNEAIDKFNALFLTSIKNRLRSDVQVGSCISGGLDSSSIVAGIRQLKSGSFKTFSAVFPGFEKDESIYIDKITRQFQLENHKISPTADQLLLSFKNLCYHQEEPFASSSIFTQYKVFELARQNHTKVLLDGQGADEILAGYHKYIHWYLQELISRYKFSAAATERSGFIKNKISFDWGLKNYLAAFFPVQTAFHLERKAYKKIIGHTDINPEYLHALKGREWDGIHKPFVNRLNDILYFNTTTAGLEELLRYADRNSMAHGVEIRLPFLNHQLVEYVFSLPASFKIQQGYTKWLLRMAMHNKLPEDIVWRTDKIGYEPPQLEWMQNKHLQEYIYEAKKKLVHQKILQEKTLNKKIQPHAAHDAQSADWRYLTAAQFL